MKALIDLDLVVYRVGAACDNWYYEYRGENFDSHKDVKKYIKRITATPEQYEKELSFAVRKRDPEEWDEVKSSVVSFVEDLIEPFDDYQGFISGKGNFRYEYAKILPYKGTRDIDSRPTFYDEIRQLLVDVYEAAPSVGMEADDALGISMTSDVEYMEPVLLTLDKDLDMIPGRHYNWERDQRYIVDDVDAARSFYCQMLTGDSTDNILGLYGVGQNSAHVKKIKLMEDEDQMKEYVVKEYTARFGGYADIFLKENSILLWILRADKKNPFDPSDYYVER